MSEKHAKHGAGNRVFNCTSTVQSQIIIFPLGLGKWDWWEGEEGVKKMDKHSDQRQPLRRKGVQSEGKEGEERGEKR